MTHFTEHSLEMAIMSMFENEGYVYTNGENVHKKMDDVLLRDDLQAYLRERYAKDIITAMEVENAISAITANRGFTDYERNAQTFRLLIEGFSLKREDPSKPDLFIEPIDFENVRSNRFRIVNQLEIQGRVKRIPDAVVYVNGLPLVVLEFKSAVKEDTTITDAYKQLTIRYRRDIPELFKYNAFVVISDGVNNKYGTLYTPYDYFYAWRKTDAKAQATDGIDSLTTMVEGMFRKERLLSVVKDFVYFPDSSKKEEKIICRYPQFFATHLLFDNILRHSHINIHGDGKGGTYFGATGCGKSFTMLFLSRMLMRSREMHNPTILLITDRTDLDIQLSEQFGRAKQFIGDDCVVEVDSRARLGELLRGRTGGGVFLTTIHKFTEATGLLSNRANIICISDEAHRSQTNMMEHVTRTDEGVRRSYGFARYLHESLPCATYVGFTGTPVDSTLQVFGPVVDAYTMTESVADGITRRIVYEGRAAKVLVDNKKVEQIEEYYNKCAEEGANEYQIQESKKAMTNMEIILDDPIVLQRIAEDFVRHYEQRIAEGSTVEEKAMIVCPNRLIAFHLYKKIAALRPEWAEVPQQAPQCTEMAMAADSPATYGASETLPIERMRMIMTRGKDDEPELWNMLGTDEYKQTLATQFKDPKSNFKIAVVVDMWITGFDVPCLDTMYLYKPLQQHTLIQTISRVNRVYPGKEKGLVVDYLGIKKNLNAALKKYTPGGKQEEDVETIQKSITMVRDELDILRRIFGKHDYSLFTTGNPREQLNALNKGAEYVQETEERENQFMGHAKKMKQAFNLCSTSEEFTNAEREDVHFFTAVRSIIYKLTKGDAPDATQMNRHVAKMIENAIQSEGVEEIVQIGNDKEKLDLLSEDYMERLKKLQLPNTKVKLMERLLRMVIGDFKKVNKMKGVDFTKRLNIIVNKYNDRSDDAALANDVLNEVVDKLSELLTEVNDEKKSFIDTGISYEEKAFYDILKHIAEQFGFEYPEEKLIALAQEIKKIVDDKSNYTDWAKRDDIKAELKMDLILILDEYSYPPVTNDAVYKEIFEQAENFKKYND